jgi:hypothetical protein
MRAARALRRVVVMLRSVARICGARLAQRLRRLRLPTDQSRAPLTPVRPAPASRKKTKGLSTLVLVDFVLNSLDRKINCFLLRDTTRGMTKDGRKYASVAMIDNEGAGWTAYGTGRVRRHSKVLHYRNDKHYHGWKDKEGLRYAIEKEAVDGSAGRKRKCNFCPPRLHRNAIAKLGMEDVAAARRREERQPETKLSSRLLAALMVSRRVGGQPLRTASDLRAP